MAFINKPEEVEVLDDHSALIAHDDDRTRVKEPESNVQRQGHELVYSVVTSGNK